MLARAICALLVLVNDFPAIVKQVAGRVKCDKSGSCIVFATELCSAASAGDFTVCTGSVCFGRGSLDFRHVWIEQHGEKIDPTLEQFSFYDLSTVVYTTDKRYTPDAFASAVSDHPQRARFSELQKP